MGNNDCDWTRNHPTNTNTNTNIPSQNTMSHYHNTVPTTITTDGGGGGVSGAVGVGGVSTMIDSPSHSNLSELHYNNNNNNNNNINDDNINNDDNNNNNDNDIIENNLENMENMIIGYSSNDHRNIEMSNHLNLIPTPPIPPLPMPSQNINNNNNNIAYLNTNITLESPQITQSMIVENNNNNNVNLFLPNKSNPLSFFFHFITSHTSIV